jgi:hypothetical protein
MALSLSPLSSCSDRVEDRNARGSCIPAAIVPGVLGLSCSAHSSFIGPTEHGGELTPPKEGDKHGLTWLLRESDGVSVVRTFSPCTFDPRAFTPGQCVVEGLRVCVGAVCIGLMHVPMYIAGLPHHLSGNPQPPRWDLSCAPGGPCTMHTLTTWRPGSVKVKGSLRYTAQRSQRPQRVSIESNPPWPQCSSLRERRQDARGYSPMHRHGVVLPTGPPAIAFVR